MKKLLQQIKDIWKTRYCINLPIKGPGINFESNRGKH